MTAHLLDNPVWSSLTTKHASLAVMQESAGRYPPQVAPFAAVRVGDARALSQLEVLINGGESVYFVGVAPGFGTGWRVESAGLMPQLVCKAPAVTGKLYENVFPLTYALPALSTAIPLPSSWFAAPPR